MAITAARASTTLQTASDSFQTLYDAIANNHQPAHAVKIECVGNGLIAQINGDTERNVVVTANSIEYLRAVGPGGVHKVEVKNLTAGSNATLYHSDGTII